MRMFAGFTSRWTSPRSCAASRADATCATTPAARLGSNAPSAARSARRSVPSTKRIALEALPEPLTVGERLADHLERDGPPQRDLHGSVDDTHAASADLIFDPE